MGSSEESWVYLVRREALRRWAELYLPDTVKKEVDRGIETYGKLGIE